jgi:periplasmic divalent cation tolerance protein
VTDKVVVLITAANPEECQKIAHSLVENRLAACVNITTPVRSIYRWEGKVADEQECLMLIKTSRSLFGALRDQVARLHSYDTPEIICLPILAGSQKYLAWLTENVSE